MANWRSEYTAALHSRDERERAKYSRVSEDFIDACVLSSPLPLTLPIYHTPIWTETQLIPPRHRPPLPHRRPRSRKSRPPHSNSTPITHPIILRPNPPSIRPPAPPRPRQRPPHLRLPLLAPQNHYSRLRDPANPSLLLRRRSLPPHQRAHAAPPKSQRSRRGDPRQGQARPRSARRECNPEYRAAGVGAKHQEAEGGEPAADRAVDGVEGAGGRGDESGVGEGEMKCYTQPVIM